MMLCRHKYFNTNNLWVNLPSLKAALDESKGVLQLPLIKNKKTVNPRDSDTPAVFQLETAMGSAIECFKDAGAVVVPRDRFAPVKTCNDLFALRSDVYEVGNQYCLHHALSTTHLACSPSSPSDLRQVSLAIAAIQVLMHAYALALSLLLMHAMLHPLTVDSLMIE